MARSRLEKIGTIYTRTRGLIQSGAVHWDDRPLWYDLYEAFPPLEEPRFDRPVPNVPLKKIFYEEDKIRALLHNRNKQIGTVNMFNNASSTLSKRFIEAYKKLEKQHDGSASQEQLYEETIELLQRERQKQAEMQLEDEQVSLVSSFKRAQEQRERFKDSANIAIKVSDLFKKE
ncbi:hypothetical protein ILUMI_10507 [Ignelater luminosus]|uniref:Small ribosomal subunit protein mS23 n=1 Tax=Ignelater luminosus TaxID=2038154 RepID=A0A8K0GEV9_IGNLU|nr:hypothetical protein ILUMI_10507 [Ignelater luminosus]